MPVDECWCWMSAITALRKVEIDFNIPSLVPGRNSDALQFDAIADSLFFEQPQSRDGE
jgi:hypothetical protein